MSRKIASVQAETDPWETGELGRSLEHAQVADEAGEDEAIDQAANLRQISIRLEQSLIDAFKLIASRNKNIGYQTLMRQSLKRFAMAEIKRIAAEMEAEVEASERAQKEALACQKETAAA
jgi:predicted DNA binding CopG/RHH family protein